MIQAAVGEQPIMNSHLEKKSRLLCFYLDGVAVVNMPKLHNPDVIILREAKPGWSLISCSKEVSIWIRTNYEETEQWEAYLDQEWRIYYNKLVVHNNLITILQIKYNDVIDRRDS